nr:alpha-glucoside-specific PTS transporter subunit IIBC [Pectinatus sottacetonis]
MQKVQRFGGAMFTPVLLFTFFGIMAALSILFKNTAIMGNIADKGTIWYDIWFIVEKGAWTVFAQLPLLFVVGLPIGLAKKDSGRAAMETLVIYLAANYFIAGFLELWGPFFGVDYSQKAAAGSGLAMIANIKTLDMGMLGAIFIAGLSVYLHNKLSDVDLPEIIGIFRGSVLVVAAGFFIMLPVALLLCFVWPKVQLAILSLQGFMKASGLLGVWLYTFLERILIPTGLHHFIYMPFIYGPAVVDGGTKQYFIQHIPEFSTSAHTLKEMFPQGGFDLTSMSKMFGCPGIALAIYATAKKSKKKIIAGLLIPAVLTAILCGVTEPLEFTFLFIAPMLFAVHAVLAGLMAMTAYAFGVVGAFDGGLIECAVENWIPLFKYHSTTYIIQFAVGFVFTAIYFFVFRWLIIHFDFKTPGRGDDSEDKLYTKADYKAKKNGDERDKKAAAFLSALGGKDNIADVTNCATRLRVNVKDDSMVKNANVFIAAGAHGLVHNKNAIQVIVGLSVPQVRERFENLLQSGSDTEPKITEPVLKAFATGQVVKLEDVPDAAFSEKTMGDGLAIIPQYGIITAPADGTVMMIMDKTGHAVGLRLNTGMEILIHIGIDTINLNGSGFEILIEAEQAVKTGDKLIKFDIEKIKQSGLNPITMMVITNFDQYTALKFKQVNMVEAGKTTIAIY